jgi:hypothetical protein
MVAKAVMEATRKSSHKEGQTLGDMAMVSEKTAMKAKTIPQYSIETTVAKTEQAHQKVTKQKNEIMHPVHILADAVPATKEAIKFVIGNLVRDVREAFRDSDAVGEL